MLSSAPRVQDDFSSAIFGTFTRPASLESSGISGFVSIGEAANSANVQKSHISSIFSEMCGRCLSDLSICLKQFSIMPDCCRTTFVLQNWWDSVGGIEYLLFAGRWNRTRKFEIALLDKAYL